MSEPVGSPTRGRWSTTSLPVRILGLGMLAQAIVAPWMVRDSWFHRDAWHYLTRRGIIPEADVGLWEPWSGHWQTVPVLIYRSLFAIVGVESYLPYVLVSVVLHLVVCGLVYAVLVRAGATGWVALVTSWLILFYGGGSEPYLSDAPIPLTLTLALGLTAILIVLADRPASWRWAVVAGLLVVGVMTSGLALVLLVVIPLVARPTWGTIRALLVAVPAGLLFVGWYLAVGSGGGRLRLSGWEYAEVPVFVLRGLTGVPSKVVGSVVVGAVILGWLVVVAVRDRGEVPPPLRRLARISLLGAVLVMTLFGIAVPPEMGVSGATQARYVYVALVLSSPAVALGLTLVARWSRRQVESGRVRAWLPPVLAIVLMAGATGVGMVRQWKESRWLHTDAMFFRTWALGSLAAERAGETMLSPVLSTPWNSDDLDLRLVTAPVFARQLGDEPVTARQRLTAENLFFTAVGAQDHGLPAPGELWVDGEAVPTTSGCRDFPGGTQPVRVAFRVGEGSSVEVRSAATTVVTRVHRDGMVSDAVRWEVTGGSAQISSTARDAVLTATLPDAGGFTVCLR